MKSRDIIDVRMDVWFGFNFTGGGVYFFEVRCCNHLVVAGYPLIELGVSIMDMLTATSFILKEVLENIPTTISAGTHVPYLSGSGEYEVPVDIKFDKASALSLVSPQDYTALSVIPWGVPRFFKSSIEYIPAAGDYSAIPESIPNMDKEELPGDGAIFMPIKSQYGVEQYWFANRDSQYDTSYFTYWGAFLYSGCDLEENHVVLNCEIKHPYSGEPNSASNSKWQIGSCHEEYAGYPIRYIVQGPYNYAETDRHVGWLDPQYYPPRSPVNGVGQSFGFILAETLLSTFGGFMGQGGGFFGIRLTNKGEGGF